MDNFDDFTPSSKSSSTLASIFGKSNTSLENSSLTYTPTKQPKKTTLQEPSSNVKLELIIFKSVHAFKLVNGVYQPLGKMGLALVGCKSPPVFQLLLYKNKEDVACKIRIHATTEFSILDNNYASFYSEDQINYSVMFEIITDVEAFGQQFVLRKSFLSSQIVTQDLIFSNEEIVPNECELHVRFTPHEVVADKINALSETEEAVIKLSEDGNEGWMQILMGMKYGGKRVAIIPVELSGRWKDRIQPGGKLMIVAEIFKNVSEQVVEEKPTIFFNSSGEESASFKEKGAMIEGVISGTSQKSGLLSRVARLGQATLPLKGAIAADITDSEDDSSPSPKPRIRSKPPISVPRDVPLRVVQKISEIPAPQPIAIYQPQFPPQILNPGYGPFVATTPTNLVSPVDNSFSAHFAESRTQAAELRMGLSKITDKIDFVINKLNSGSTPSIYPPADSTGILGSVQALVQENQSLKDKVEEQKIKLDTQSERIYHLLELSHKSLEQNATNLNQDELQAAKNEINCLKTSLQENKAILENSELENSKLNSTIITLEKRLNELKGEFEKSLQELSDENTKLKNLHSNLLKQIDELEKQRENLIGEADSVKEELKVQSQKNETLVAQLLTENQQSKVKIEETLPADSNTNNTKALMNLVYKNLYIKFNAEDQYSGTAIKQVLATVIKDMTLEFLEKSENFPQGDPKSISNQTPTDESQTSSDQISPLASPIQTSPGAKNVDTDGPQTFSKYEEENQIMYNQVWQTSEPPPLPTFDDDEENVW